MYTEEIKENHNINLLYRLDTTYLCIFHSTVYVMLTKSCLIF